MLNRPGDSKIFVPYRALGFICNNLPICLKYNERLKQYYVVAAITKAIHLYKCKGLRLVSVSKPLPTNIELLAADNYFIYASSKNVLYGLHLNQNLVNTYNGHKDDIIAIVPFGLHVISADKSSHIIVWEIESQEKYTEILFDKLIFEVSVIMHPHTYVNKLLFGSLQGTLELWNIKSHKIIYQFKGWESKINVIEQTTAIDVVGIGLDNGQIKIHNIKFDQTIATFQQDWGPVLTLAFRTDGPTTFVSGSNDGHLAIWDLTEKKLVAQMRRVHNVEGNALTIKFIPFKSLLVTSSSDNSLKVWNFDNPDDTGSLLYIREGHRSPVSRIRFHGLGGENILSSGSDGTFRVFSLVHDGRNKVFGRRCLDGKKLDRRKKKKGLRTGLSFGEERGPPGWEASVGSAPETRSILLPPITDFASEGSRQRDWDDIVCCHRGLPYATTWSFYASAVGRHVLKPPSGRRPDFPGSGGSQGRLKAYSGPAAVACTLTSCANFALIGYESGHIDKFNMQSGIYRGSYSDAGLLNADSKSAVSKATTVDLRYPAHSDRSITLLKVDHFNTQVVSGAYGDPSLRFWAFNSRKLFSTLALPAPPARSNALNRQSSLLALGLEDYTIAVVDVVARTLVRHLSGHSGTITDVALKWDSRWLHSSGMDGLLKTWDVPSGSLVDVFRTASPVVSFDVSPIGQQFLATAHLGDRGVYLWSDRTLYNYVNLGPLPVGYEPPLLGYDLTLASWGGVGNISDETEPVEGEGLTNREDIDDENETEINDTVMSTHHHTGPEARSDRSLVTLSQLPMTYGRSVIYHDRLRARNRGKVTAMGTALPTGGRNDAAAPFFLGDNASAQEKRYFETQTILKKGQGSAKIFSSHVDGGPDPDVSDVRKSLASFGNRTPFGESLLKYLSAKANRSTDTASIFDGLLDTLLGFGPSSANFEIELLSPINQAGSSQLLVAFLTFLGDVFVSKTNYEVAQTYLCLLTKLHFQAITEEEETLEPFLKLANHQTETWSGLEKDFLQCQSLVSCFKNPFN